MTSYRMRELEARVGLPRSTIHYYLREGLLPPVQKTARNAALYGPEHLQRLEILRRLREPPLGPLPRPLMKRVVQLTEQGIELEAAVALQRAVLGPLAAEWLQESFTLSDLAKRAGAPVSFVEQMLEVGLLVPAPGETAFDATDLGLVRLCHRLASDSGLPLEAGRRISQTIKELSQYEMSLRNHVVGKLPEADAAELTRRFQEAVHAIHNYLFYRWRLHDIAALGEGLIAKDEEKS